MNKPSKRGFTLVELSIVLVIIGLLIGGILVAQSMISTAKIQMLIRSLQQYEVAVNNFKTSYKYYPGDDPFFTPAGNGDNVMSYGAGGSFQNCNGVYDNYEYLQTWAHLAQAKMISGNYTAFSPGATGGGPNCGGTQNSNSNDASLMGVVFPFTELDSRAASYVGFAKMPVIVAKPFAYSNFYFSLTLSAPVVIPLETKLGSLPETEWTSGNYYYDIGIMNTQGGPGLCHSPNLSSIACSDPTAESGWIYYLIGPT